MANDLRTVLIAGIISTTMFIPYAAAESTKPEAHRKGSFSVTFEEYSPLSNTRAISQRMSVRIESGPYKRHHYDILSESFEAYVPESYDPNTPYGLIVWVSASPNGGTTEECKQILDKHKLIWIGANKSGNKESTYNRRFPLALDAAYNMQKLYNIDPNRVYVSGISGGGRVASMTAFHHSDVYAGGIFIIGANFWKSMSVPGQRGKYWRKHCHKPHRIHLLRARRFGRYVFLTGDNDGNRLQMHTYYEKGYKKILNNVLYIQVPGMGHEPPPIEWFEKAIQYLDKPPEKTQSRRRSRY